MQERALGALKRQRRFTQEEPDGAVSGRAQPGARRLPGGRGLEGAARAPLSPCAPGDPESQLQSVPSLHWHCLEFPTANSFLHAKRFSPKM